MQQQPKVIATGDFLYFAPEGKDFTLPAPGTVSSSSKPGATDGLWTTYVLGTVKKPTVDKIDSKPVKIKAPMPGTGTIVTMDIKRTEHDLTMEVEMNELG